MNCDGGYYPFKGPYYTDSQTYDFKGEEVNYKVRFLYKMSGGRTKLFYQVGMAISIMFQIWSIILKLF
jgi:hypothetical protein